MEGVGQREVRGDVVVHAVGDGVGYADAGEVEVFTCGRGEDVGGQGGEGGVGGAGWIGGGVAGGNAIACWRLRR